MDFIHRRFQAILAGTAALTLLSATAFAQSTTPVHQAQTEENGNGTVVSGDGTVLDPILVTAGRPGAMGDTVLTTTIPREELTFRQIDNVNEIGKLAPNVDFNQSNGSFNIRGLDQGRVLTTIDGIRLPYLRDGARSSATGANYAGGVNLIDTDMLSAIDIVKGADSSVFGSGALGGVVAFRTLEPEDLIAPGKVWGGLTKLSFDSRDDSFHAGQALASRINNTYALVQGSYRFGEELKNQGKVGGTGPTRTKPNPEDYELGAFLGKINHHVAGGHVFGLTGEIFRRDSDAKLLTSETAAYDNYRASDVDSRDRASLSYTFNAERQSQWADAAYVVAYWQRQDLNTITSATRLTPPAGPYKRGSHLESEIYGVNGNVVKTLFFQGQPHEFTVGGELFGSTYEQFAHGKDNCNPSIPTCAFLHANQADSPRVVGATLGLFIEDKIGFMAGRMRLIPGIRFDWYEQTPKSTPAFEDNAAYMGLPPANSDSAFSPKLRLEFDVRPAVTLYAQWAQGFRAPDPVDLYMNYGGLGTYLRKGNPDLKPEKSNGFEVGLRAGDRDLGLKISLFDNYYKDFIDTETYPSPLFPVGGITEAINRDRVRIYGAELTLHGRHASGVHGWAMLGYANGKDTKNDIYLDTIPPFKAVFGTGYDAGWWGTDAIVTIAGPRDKVPDDLSEAAQKKLKTDPYATVDLTAWWKPQAVDGLLLQAGVFNLFDQTYVDALNVPPATSLSQAYFTEPGRTFKLTGTLQF
ncbi:TonB-dependent hemoglobin/transferrin/lactoferrin family receptor [Rhodoligotrophos defluvii]|uniref:TonB-dependent hemoglobin/transferrin/lactoferrin family receptor n=1 Tax=Rhodoligotrophos defluvii TaxID=2561934 RepID=UPI0010C975DA|nr:TonB-dependent hemoglobin/transferrin/lactoferrin family receptor [Rhodoligotrophos defluvii]